MIVTINGNDLNVEVLGPENAPVLIAHHGGGGIGSLAEPKATFGPLADEMRVVVFDARGCGRSEGTPPFSHAQWAADVDGLRALPDPGDGRSDGLDHAGLIGRDDRVTDPRFPSGDLREIRALTADRGGRPVPGGGPRVPAHGSCRFREPVARAMV